MDNIKNLIGITEYLKAIESAGYEVRLHRDKITGSLRGYGLTKDGTYMDASAIDKKFTIKNLSFVGHALQYAEETKKEKLTELVQHNEKHTRLRR